MSQQDPTSHTAPSAHYQDAQAGAGSASGTGGARGHQVSPRLSLDATGLVLYGPALGLVRREGGHRPLRHRPQVRRLDGASDPRAGGDLPGIPARGSRPGPRRWPWCWSPPSGTARARTLRNGSSSAAAWSSPSTAVVSSGRAPNRTRGGWPRRRCRQPTCRVRAQQGRPLPPEEDEQSADVADDAVACRHRVTPGLAARALQIAACASI